MDDLLRAAFARHEELVPAAAPGLRTAILAGARQRRARRRWRLGGLLGGLAALLALLVVPVAARSAPGGGAPAAPGRPLHLLLVGIDRVGEAPAAQVRADAMVLVHIEPGRRRAYAVVIPQDLLIDLAGLGRQPASSAYLLGGYRIVADAVGRMTGVPLDGGAVVDIPAMESITDAAGGVDLCVGQRVESRHLAYDETGQPAEPSWSHPAVVYEPGCRHYDSREAVDYLREAVGRGDEAALHTYLTALARSAAQPVRLPAVLAAAGQGIEMHFDGGLTGLTGVARGVDPAAVTAVRLPTSTSDYGRTPAADGDGLYQALRDGTVGPWLAEHPQYASA